MQYVIIFIVILIIMGAMNLFLFLSLQSTAAKIREQVDEYFIRKLEFLDDLYDEKVRKLRMVKNELDQYVGMTYLGPKEESGEPEEYPQTPRRAEAPVPGSTLAGTAGYINKDFIQDYRYVRNHFKVDLNQALKEVEQLPKDQEALHHGQICRHMHEMLNFDVVYQLGLLSVEDQHEILFEMFDDEEDEVLRRYDTEHPDFLIVEFRDYLRMEAELNRDRLLVKAGSGEDLADMDVEVEEDASIGEGAKIYSGNKMYDYSI